MEHFNFDHWNRVSCRNPCPICGKPDNCSVSRDGSAVWCGRVAEGARRQNSGGQYLHLDVGEKPQNVLRLHVGSSGCEKPREKSKTDWNSAAESLFRGAEAARSELAQELGVSVDSLEALGVGWHEGGQYWNIPERDADSRIIGLSLRYRDGRKKRSPGGKAGLTLAEKWNTGVGPILLVEGASDTAALITIGLSAVGRPSNCGGVSHLVDLLFNTPVEREIIVIGERDQKEDGRWPGRDGAIGTARQLAEELERPVAWSLPPDDAKDSRDWLYAMPTLPVERLANLYVTGLEPTVCLPPPIVSPERADGPALPIGDWRALMLRARIESLDCPGIYLDRSRTGAGKSRVDLAAILCARHRGAAT